ncbi:biotin transporter BioY [Pelagibacterales bacterium SAG-MED31]|nr:biotin transporter BioY [Pelagibacterales bacterium SAG-MED31]
MNNSRILINNLKIFQGINQNITSVLLIIFGTLLLTISAKVQVPFWPVPMTMQTFVVFLIGSTYGVRLSFLTLVAYLIEGALGLPVFAAGGGIIYLTGPTAGYLYGMTIAAAVISYFANIGYSTSYIKSFISIIIGSIIIFALGVLYLGSIIGYSKALQAGLLPFIPSELFKIALAVLLIPTLNKIIK